MSNTERDRESKVDKGAPPSHTPIERLTKVEVQNRIDTCFDLRYNNPNKPILQREWLDYCEKHYGDKSRPQYINYWMSAKEQYDEAWKGRLEGLLEPAMVELTELLHSDNPLVKQKAIDQIVKFTGNDIQKHLVAIQEIKEVSFGSDN